MEYFFDTSAIVKIYHEEEGSKAVLPIYSGKSNHLFSLDALQIATLSVVSDNDTTFVCADKRLISLVNSFGYKSLSL